MESCDVAYLMCPINALALPCRCLPFNTRPRSLIMPPPRPAPRPAPQVLALSSRTDVVADDFEIALNETIAALDPEDATLVHSAPGE